MSSIKTHTDLRSAFSTFWEKRNHKEVPPIKLVLENDPTTLFNGSGMQQLVPYLLGQEHPLGNRLYNIQRSFRSQDIEEIGDNRHTTFFEMMGNWSLGDYFKEEQLTWFWEFLTKYLGLQKEKLYVTVFEGNNEVPKDKESISIWKKIGISNDHIHEYPAKKNWWSRAGEPEHMPAGEPGGPTSEVFYEFTEIAHDPKFGKDCHPNCDCGRFIEIGNSVFMEYKKTETGLEALSQKNVDFGGGLERILMALNN
ncbi:MAG: alanine--tRNA ligase-related protein, partial [Candidatus Roizmanbacteria bacterium]|nr:alanine--tRNA ligase-related protein [Candidatus Roizmanbacteria bacterium]